MRSKLDKFLDLLQVAIAPYHITFVAGHWYLQKSQIKQLSEILDEQPVNEEFVEHYEQQFAQLIGHGKGKSFASGRMAFYVLMKVLGIGRGDEVILPGFTCSVMVNAVYRIGATPIYADIDPETFGSDAKSIQKVISPRSKLIVAQHSFGIPCKIDEIIQLGKKYGIYVIEDSAISLDSSYKGTSVGNWGDAAIFSTDHTKPINTIIGGILYTNNMEIFGKVKTFSRDIPCLSSNHQKRLFQRMLLERKSYCPYKLPRTRSYEFLTSLKNRLLPKPLRFRKPIFLEEDYKKTSSSSAYPYPAKFPSFLAQLGIWELQRWSDEKFHRKDLLREYLKFIQLTSWGKYIPKGYLDKNNDIVPLRFVLSLPDADFWKRRMRQKIDIHSFWFCEPIICCPDGPKSLGYREGCCLNSEKISRNIINWPCVIAEGWKDRLLEIMKSSLNDV